jgi:hypothetical protein
MFIRLVLVIVLVAALFATQGNAGIFSKSEGEKAMDHAKEAAKHAYNAASDTASAAAKQAYDATMEKASDLTSAGKDKVADASGRGVVGKAIDSVKEKAQDLTTGLGIGKTHAERAMDNARDAARQAYAASSYKAALAAR